MRARGYGRDCPSCPKVAGDTVYMLANETGKVRNGQTAIARHTHTLRVLFLSDAEVSLTNHMAEGGRENTRWP